MAFLLNHIQLKLVKVGDHIFELNVKTIILLINARMRL
jgi:hypothetical protein